MRPGEERDVCDLVIRVFEQFVAPDFSHEGIHEFCRYADPGALSDRVASGDEVLVAVSGDLIIGILELRGRHHIAMLFVESRGKGVGRQLVEEAVQICRVGRPAFDKVTVKSSRYAVPVYRKLGFEVAGHEQIENGIISVPMALELGNTGPKGPSNGGDCMS